MKKFVLIPESSSKVTYKGSQYKAPKSVVRDLTKRDKASMIAKKRSLKNKGSNVDFTSRLKRLNFVKKSGDDSHDRASAMMKRVLRDRGNKAITTAGNAKSKGKFDKAFKAIKIAKNLHKDSKRIGNDRSDLKVSKYN